jgi:hypothetical protein
VPADHAFQSCAGKRDDGVSAVIFNGLRGVGDQSRGKCTETGLSGHAPALCGGKPADLPQSGADGRLGTPEGLREDMAQHVGAGRRQQPATADNAVRPGF